MQERLIAAVDLGSFKTSLSVSKVENGGTQVLYYRELPSEGVLRGNIFNPKKACGPLRTLIADAQESLGINISSIAVALPRWNVKAESVEFSTDRSDADEFISEEEVAALKEMARNDYSGKLPADCQVYGAVAQSFSTEDLFQVSEDDVVGVTGAMLTGRFLIFSGPKKPISNIDKLANELGLAVCEELFVPEIEADCVLTEDEKEHGVALVEIGGGITSVAVFYRGIMRSYAAFPFGGKSITNDIRQECGIQEALAENIKLGYGGCMPDRLLSLGEKILQIEDGRTGDCQQLPVKYLSEIIGSRMHEIAEAVLHLIGESGYSDNLRGGIVLTGGASELLSCYSLFADMSGVNCRIAYPHGNGVLTEGCEDIESTSAAAQMAMVSVLKDYTHINCGAELKEQEEPTPAPEIKEVEITADTGDGTLFQHDEAYQEAKVNKPEKKDVKPRKKPNTKNRVVNFFDKLAGNVGSMYDNMGKSSEEQEEK